VIRGIWRDNFRALPLSESLSNLLPIRFTRAVRFRLRESGSRAPERRNVNGYLNDNLASDELNRANKVMTVTINQDGFGECRQANVRDRIKSRSISRAAFSH